MALSQKYSGKVLVPWFNTSEWRSVYNLLRSASNHDHKITLDMLRIWKTRTPLLSAGIEGTLILLEALHLEKHSLSDTQIVQIYSVSLMRFLNICAANNERQGTFYQSISRTDLPKWLIDIRHDIAHDNKMPSISLLEIGIKKSFEWLMEKYWEVQNTRMCDFTVCELTETEDVDLMQAYIRLRGIEDSNALNEISLSSIKQLIGSRYSQTHNDRDSLLSILEDVLNRFIGDTSNSGNLQNQLKMLVKDNALLGVKLESTTEGKDQIAKDSRDCWANILNIIFNHGLLFTLLHELYKVICDPLQLDNFKLVSALWIQEILKGLMELETVKQTLMELSEGNVMKTKSPRSTARAQLKKENKSFENCLRFEEINLDFSKDAREFRDIVLSSPSIYSPMFLKSLSYFSKESDESWSNLAKLYLEPMTSMWEDEIMTVNHIDGLLGSSGMHSGNDQTNSVMSGLEVFSNRTICNKWEKIQDTRPFQKCPLGLLPHQSNTMNPTILV